MHLQGLVTDREAVSPVIGVVLMVAITVILAAVIGTFVLGIGTAEETPQAAFEFEQVKEGGAGNPDEFDIAHAGGDSIPNDELYVTGDVPVQDDDGTPGPEKRLTFEQVGDDGDEFEAGDAVTVEPPDTDPEIEDDTYRIVWDDGEGTAVLAVERGENM